MKISQNEHVIITPKSFQDTAFQKHCAGYGRLEVSGAGAAYQLSKDFSITGISYAGFKSYYTTGSLPQRCRQLF